MERHLAQKCQLVSSNHRRRTSIRAGIAPPSFASVNKNLPSPPPPRHFATSFRTVLIEARYSRASGTMHRAEKGIEGGKSRGVLREAKADCGGEGKEDGRDAAVNRTGVNDFRLVKAEESEE